VKPATNEHAGVRSPHPHRRAKQLLGLLILSLAAAAQAQPCTQVQLCIALDGSGSISSSNFSLMKTGLADALRDTTIVPRDGSVQISVAQFGDVTRTEIAPTIINSDAVATSFASQIEAIAKVEGGTPMDQAINQCASLLNKSCPGRQVINIVTDGEPNDATATVTARVNAVAAGVDEVNAEAVAAPQSAFLFLRDQLVWPQPGVEAPPFISGGFVIRTDSFADFAVAVRGKIGQIVGPLSGCTIEPPMANNPVGSQHSFTVTVKKDGVPQADVAVTVTIISGPNAGGTGSNTTRADGTVGVMYTSNGIPGTDVIRATGTLDAPFLCTASKTWDPPTCTIEPPSDTNQVGEQHSMTVTVRRADGSLVGAGVAVTVDITAGPNAPDSGTFTTNSSGAVEVFYTGNGGAGIDTILASGTVDGAPFSCTATKTWTPPHPDCTITPQAETNPINTQHQMTVRVTFGGAPRAGAQVTVAIISGPNSPDSGVATTDANGEISVVYPGAGGPGTDTIRASGSIGGTAFSCTATKTWVLPPPLCTISPASDINPVGTRHDMIVTVSRGGVALSGVSVTVDIVSGPNAPDSGTFTTSSSGQVSVFYDSNGVAGSDSIVASGSAGGVPFSCTASKQWLAPTATRTRSSTPTHTPTRTFTPTRTASATPTLSATRTATRTQTASRTPTPSPTTTASRTPTSTRSATVSPTAARKPTFTPTQTYSPSATPLPTQTEQPSSTEAPSASVTVPPTPTRSPTAQPSTTATSTPPASTTPSPTRSTTPSRSPTSTASPSQTAPSTATASATELPSMTPSQTPADTPTASPIHTPKQSFTPTATQPPTPTSMPTAVVSPPPTAPATPSATPGPCSCVGDCDCDGEVTVNEMVTAVRVALEEVDVRTCLPGDANGDAQITIDEILTSIHNGLTSCMPDAREVHD
jgi:uncharacterized protein YegL